MPAVAHTVHRLDGIEGGIDLVELASYAFDMGGNGVVVQHHAGGVHQLLAVFDVARVFGEGMHDPEFCQGQFQGLFLPAGTAP